MGPVHAWGGARLPCMPGVEQGTRACLGWSEANVVDHRQVPEGYRVAKK
jgi:hypothetical protein